MKKKYFQPIRIGMIKNAYADWPRDLFTLARPDVDSSETVGIFTQTLHLYCGLQIFGFIWAWPLVFVLSKILSSHGMGSEFYWSGQALASLLSQFVLLQYYMFLGLIIYFWNGKTKCKS